MSSQHRALPPGACRISQTLPHIAAPSQLNGKLCRDCHTVATQAKLVTLCCSPASLGHPSQNATIWQDVLPPAVGPSAASYLQQAVLPPPAVPGCAVTVLQAHWLQRGHL